MTQVAILTSHSYHLSTGIQVITQGGRYDVTFGTRHGHLWCLMSSAGIKSDCYTRTVNPAYDPPIYAFIARVSQYTHTSQVPPPWLQPLSTTVFKPRGSHNTRYR